MTIVLDELPLVSEAERARILDAPRTPDAHADLLAAVPAMNAVQRGGCASARVLPSAFTVVTWNVERCLFPNETAAKIADTGADIVLLSEVDHGMARTGQCHTAEDVADALGMEYIFGVEFFEMGLGSPSELGFCTDHFNTRGWHGNAILSRVPFSRVELVRLDDHGHWYCKEFGADPQQPRLGGRMALLAEVHTESGPVCVVSTHLESNAGAQHRHEQFEQLLDRIAVFAPDLPVVIGGDLNTGNHIPPNFDWRDETLFDLARARGFRWDATPDGMTTRPSLITRHPERAMKLDWFATLGMSCKTSALIPSLTPSGRPLSDHDAVVATLSVDQKANPASKAMVDGFGEQHHT